MGTVMKKTMKITLDGKEYDFWTEGNTLGEAIRKIVPLQIKLSRSADHEYYASLHEKIDFAEAEGTSHVKAGWVYFFKDWNALSINFKDMDIAPYRVFVVGKVSEDMIPLLGTAERTIEIWLK